MRGFFGVFGPGSEVDEIIARYKTYRLTLNDTGFVDNSHIEYYRQIQIAQ
jgi:hypothetical protein